MDPELQAIVERMVAAGESEDDIALVIQNYQPTTSALQRFAGMIPASTPVVGLPAQAIAHPEQLRSIGGAVGGMGGAAVAGPPGGVAGAAAGGGLGEALRRFLKGEPLDEVTGYAKAAGMEGGTQALGWGVGAAAGKVGHGLYKAALRPSTGLRREFGDVAATGLREGIPVTPGGVETAGARVSASRGAAMGMLDDAAATAAPVTAGEVTPALRETIETALRQQRVGENPNLGALGQRLRQLTRTFTPGVGLDEAQGLKETAQDLASTAYRAQDKGAVINSLDAMANKDTAAAIQKAIEARVPGIKAQNLKTQELLGLLRALEDADLARLSGPAPGLTNILNRIPTSPAVMSQTGIGLSRTGTQAPANLARAIVALLEADQR